MITGLTVDLVDVALDLGLSEELVVDIPLRVGVLHLLKTGGKTRLCDIGGLSSSYICFVG